MKYTIIEDLEQGSQEWLECRAGVISGTRLKNVMSKQGTETRNGLFYELIAEMLTPTSEGFTSSAMEIGHIGEDIVKEKFPEYEEVGFVFGEKRWYGFSPDGIVRNEKGEIIRTLEVKTPQAKNYVKYILENRIPVDYKWQVVMNFVVIDTLESLDFIIFNPDIIIEDLRIKRITVTRSDFIKEIEEAQEALKEFREEWLELLQKLRSK